VRGHDSLDGIKIFQDMFIAGRVGIGEHEKGFIVTDPSEHPAREKAIIVRVKGEVHQRGLEIGGRPNILAVQTGKTGGSIGIL